MIELEALTPNLILWLFQNRERLWLSSVYNNDLISLISCHYFVDKLYEVLSECKVCSFILNSFVSETKKYSDTLMSLKIAVVSNPECLLTFQGRANITGRHLCAGGTIGKDSCAGDSGGPLMAPLSMDSPPRYYQVGIVSFGEEECATKEVPGVYTRVSNYLPWILDNIE